MKIWGSLKTANVSGVVKSASKGLQKVAKATSKEYSKVKKLTGKGANAFVRARKLEGTVDEDSPMQAYVIVRVRNFYECRYCFFQMIEDYKNSIDGEAPALMEEEMDEQLLEETEYISIEFQLFF